MMDWKSEMEQYWKNKKEIDRRLERVAVDSDVKDVEKLMEANQEIMMAVREEERSSGKAEVEYNRMKEEYDKQRAKCRKIKNTRLNADILLLHDDHTDKHDEPLLDGKPSKHGKQRREQEQAVMEAMGELMLQGKEGEMVAGDAIGELGRNRTTLEGAAVSNKKLNAQQAKSSKLMAEIDKKHRFSDNLVKAAYLGVAGTVLVILVSRLLRWLFWLYHVLHK